MESENNSLFEKFRYRVLNEIIEETKSMCGSFIVVVDKKSLGILSGAVRIIDLTERGATVVELLDKSRKPIPNIDALYFITPSHKSISKLISDFSETPKYKQVHIYFTGRLQDSLMEQLAASRLVSYVSSFKEANCGFRVIGENSFSLEYSGILKELYMCRSSIDRRELVAHISRNLASVCGVLREYPYVCYWSESLLAQEVALSLESAIETLYRSAADLQINDSRPILVVLDRNYDMCQPLVHDIHYESLLKDLYEVGTDGKVTYLSIDNSNISSSKEAVINDFDKIWAKLRYLEIDEAQNQLNQDLKVFRAKFSEVEQAGKSNSCKDLKSMAKVVSGLSEYNETVNKFAVHRYLIDACMKSFAEEGITQLSEIEQMILTGFNNDKKEYKERELIAQVVDRLRTMKSDKDKLRLIMLILSAIDLSAADKQSLTEHLPPSLQDSFNILSAFKIPLNPVAKTKKRISQEKLSELQRKTPPITKIFNYATPKLHSLLSDISSNNIDPSVLTFARSAPQSDTDALPQIKSLRKRQAAPLKSKKKIIVFIIGGVSYSELRIPASFTDTQIIIGGSRVFSPLEFLEELLMINKENEVDLDPRDIELDFR